MEDKTASPGQRGVPRCDRCGGQLTAESSFRHLSEVLCEECYIQARMPLKRKTHWQYIGSIKGQYFRETSVD